jgi:hypothetical protein
MINGFVPVGGTEYLDSNTALFFTLFTKIGETIDTFDT